MSTQSVAAALLAAAFALAAPAAVAEDDACFVSAITGKVSTLFADAKTFFGFGEAAEDESCGLVAIAHMLKDPATQEKLRGLVQAKLANAEKEKAAESKSVASCCATAARSDIAAAPEPDPRLDALSKVFGPAVMKHASVAKTDDAACAAEAKSCPLEKTTQVAEKVEGEKADFVDTASLPDCCAKKLEAATD